MDFDFIIKYQSEFISGISITILASILGLILSLVLGILISTIRMSSISFFRYIATAYIEFIRNIPLLINIFIFYYGLPALGVNLSSFICGLLGLTIYNSAFIAEIFRAGIQSIPKGQTEAAISSGMNYTQCMRHIILPQAFRVVIPPLGTQFIQVIKGTSMFGIIAAGDLMYRADIIATTSLQTFDIYLFVAMLYLILTMPLNILVSYLDKTLKHKYGGGV